MPQQGYRFDYDAIGRRIAKHDAFGTTFFTWEGLRLIQEERGATVATHVHEPGRYVPLARIDLYPDLGGPEHGAPPQCSDPACRGRPDVLRAAWTGGTL